MKKYCLVSDDSGHDYVVPSDKRNEWCKLDLEDADIPEWAVMVEGGLEFENPSEFGKELFDWIEEHGIEMKPIDVSGKPMAHLFKKDLQGAFVVPKYNSALDMDWTENLNTGK